MVSKKKGVVGVSFDEVAKSLACTREQLVLIDGPLIYEEEIGIYDVGNIKGYYIKPKGVSSYGINKYKNENKKIIFESIKNWIQITIPVLSLLITIFILITSEIRIRSKTEELEELKRRLLKIEKQVVIKSAKQKLMIKQSI